MAEKHNVNINEEHRGTLRDFVNWFKENFNLDDRESKLVIKRLTEKLDNTEGTKEAFDLSELDIWFLKNYIQSAWQDSSCTVDSNDLNSFYDNIVRQENGQTNS